MEELRDVAAPSAAPVVISGRVGPQDDGYHPATKLTPAAARDYHSTQTTTFRDTAADMATAILKGQSL